MNKNIIKERKMCPTTINFTKNREQDDILE